jgi:tyrosine-protein phosphatase SIW14
VQFHPKLQRRISFAILVALSMAPAATAGPARSDSTKSESALSRIKIDNFGRVDDKYYRGAQPDGSDYADLAAAGVKMLINLTSDDAQANEEAMAAAAGMKYVQLPMTTRVPPTPERVVEFLKIVTDPANQPVYVHCVGGRHRTGVMSAIYRMAQHGWTGEQAFKEMKQYKYGADFLHPEFKTFVLGFMDDAAQAAARLIAKPVAVQN